MGAEAQADRVIAQEQALAQVTPIIADYTVFLYRDEDRNGFSDLRPRPEFMGTATFVQKDDRRYLLTAHHVWTALRKGTMVGIAVVFGGDLVQVPVALVTPISLEGNSEGPQASTEWGPDLVLLPLAGDALHTIAARRSFWNLDRLAGVKPVAADANYHGIWFFTGAPGQLAADHAGGQTLHARLYASQEAHYHERDGLDYIDIVWDRSGRARTPRSFGGMSGGGLWHISDPEDPHPVLAGTAFCESPSDEDGRGFVRCHGPRSIETLLGQAGPRGDTGT